MNKDLTVIIGAGPSGLAAAKYALQNQLNFIVLQKNDDIGGVWNPKDGLVWKNMHTNISKLNCKYTDFQWPFQPDIFPTNQQFFRYLHAYSQHYKIMDKIIFKAQVINLCQQQNQKYEIIVNIQGKKSVYIADNVIVASGLFSKIYIPENISGLKLFEGEIHHSRNYKHNESFIDKRVLVVGGSFTAIEIASDVSKTAQIVYNSFRSPFLLLSRFYKIEQDKNAPIDLLFYIRKRYIELDNSGMSPQQKIYKKQKVLLQKLCQQQQSIPQIRIEQEDLKNPMSMTITENYMKFIKHKKIVPRKTNIQKFTAKSAILDTGEQIQIDAVIFCTGCHPSTTYLSPQIKQTVKSEPWVQKHPMVLFKSIMHPQLKNLYFIGIYRGILIPICELQARFAIYMIMNKQKWPSKQEMERDINNQNEFRNRKSIPQNRYSVYGQYCDQIAPYIGLNINLKGLKQANPQKYEQFISIPLTQHVNSHSIQDIDTQLQQIPKIIQEVLKHK